MPGTISISRRVSPAFLLIVLIAQACTQKEPDTPPFHFGPVPAVLRSVLDGQPRMISVRLKDDLYIAYDAERCAPRKIWKGGIALDGAAYNNIKTVQPRSWGHTFMANDSHSVYWQIHDAGKQLDLQPVFKGYTLRDDLPEFHYAYPVLAGSEPIRIDESLAFRQGEDGSSLLERTYRLSPLPENLVVTADGHKLNPGEPTVIRHILPAVPPPEPPRREADASYGLLWLDRSGCNTCHEHDEATIGPSYLQIAARYDNEAETRRMLNEKVRRGGSGAWGTTPMTPHPQLEPKDINRMVEYILSLDPTPESQDVLSPAPATQEAVKEPPRSPGFGAPVAGLHPSFRLQNLRPPGFMPRVGGMDFLSDGRLALCTWDSIGAVYILDQVQSGDASQVRITRFAEGLHEPLGLTVVDDEIYVLQKQELTRLLDRDGDGVAEEYQSICAGFQVSADFHEYSYGLAYRDGFFYATLGLAMRLMANEKQLPDRGTTIRMDTLGHFEIINRGLRQPNGIGFGVDNELFVLENQGQWVPANKLIHVREGDFHGCRFHQGDRFDQLEMTPPAVWLPQDEIGNSPSQPVPMPHGPYAGQMLHGEVTHGGIKRVFLEKVDGAYQGAVFRFSQGLEAGINRMVWGPDSALYVGGVGMNGNWGWGDRQYGLQRLEFTGTPVFEMLAVRALPGGLEIEFTEALAPGQGSSPADFQLQQWRYEPTAAYGGPKLDLESLDVRSVALSSDRKRVRLGVDGLREGHVIYILLPENLVSEKERPLWSGEAWYTLNTIPN